MTRALRIASSLARALRTLVALPRRDRWAFAVAWWYLVWTRVALRAGWLRRRMLAERWEKNGPLCVVPPDPQALTLFAAAVLSQPSPPLCLPRSLALSSFLRGRGIRTRLCLGLRKNASGLTGHAWLEWEGGVVGDHDTVVRQFVPLEAQGAGAMRPVMEAR